MDMKTLTAENFEQEILQADKPAIVDFWATWCGPCKMFAPIFHEVAEEMGDKVIFGKVDVDEASDLASQFKVMSIPTIILFKDGKAIKKNMGVINKQTLKDFISQAL